MDMIGKKIKIIHRITRKEESSVGSTELYKSEIRHKASTMARINCLLDISTLGRIKSAVKPTAERYLFKEL